MCVNADVMTPIVMQTFISDIFKSHNRVGGNDMGQSLDGSTAEYKYKPCS